MQSENFAVQLSPPGRGAVATLLVQGPDAVKTVSELFLSTGRTSLDEVYAGRICYGRWRTADGEDVVAYRRSTAPAEIELHCHGGDVAARSILRDLKHRGCVVRSWQDSLRYTTDDPIRAEAAIALASARTRRTADSLLDQYHGALSNAVKSVLRNLKHGNRDEALATLSALNGWGDLSLHLICPWQVVLAGRPNVGKSSLINAIMGFERAIVWETPGTTRDLVTGVTAIDGWPVELVDTAGLRQTGDSVELAGVQRTSQALQAADLVVYVSAVGDPCCDSLLSAQTSSGRRFLSVLNKIDLLSLHAGQFAAAWPETAVRTSATSGTGIGELMQAIGRVLVPQEPEPGDAVPFTARQVEILRDAFQVLDHGDITAAREVVQSLLSTDIRDP